MKILALESMRRSLRGSDDPNTPQQNVLKR